MAHFALVVRVVVSACRHQDRVLEATNVDEPHPDGEEHCSQNKPQNGHRDLTNWIEEDRRHRPIERSEDLINPCLETSRWLRFRFSRNRITWILGSLVAGRALQHGRFCVSRYGRIHRIGLGRGRRLSDRRRTGSQPEQKRCTDGGERPFHLHDGIRPSGGWASNETRRWSRRYRGRFETSAF